MLFWYAKTFAVNIDQSDIYFQQQQYKLALTEYITLVSVGNARAFYQLGAIYYNGFGVEKNETKALVCLELAAQKAHVGARLRISEVKLLSKNKGLLDASGAIDLLDKLPETKAGKS